MKKLLSIIMTTTGLTLSSALAMDTVEKMVVNQPVSVQNSPVHTLRGFEKFKDSVLRNFDVLDYDVIEAYRQAFHQIETDNKKFNNVALVEPMPALDPLIKDALRHIDSLSGQFPQLNVLKKEIEYRLESEQVTPIWYLSLGFRIQAAISSDISNDERNLIKHTFHPGSALLEGLTTNNAWKVFEKSFGYFGGYRKEQRDLEFSLNLHTLDYKAVFRVTDSLEKRLPAQVIYPLLGKSKVGIPFLVHSLINDIFPIGMPTKTGKAHGVKLSPLGFAIHDFLHSKIDLRRTSLEQFVIDELANCVEKGDIQLKSKDVIIDQAVARYALRNEGLNNVFNLFLTDLNLNEEQTQKFKRAMTGMFWVLHEETRFASELYKTGNFVDVLKILAGLPLNANALNVSGISGDVKRSEDEAHYWESPKDPYVTSPFTGEPALCDAEIAVLARGAREDTRLGKDSPYKVKMTDRFVDIKFTGNKAAKIKESMPTFYHKWLNADDNIALLKYAGVTIEKPSLEGKREREARAIVFSTLTKIEEELQKLKTDFVEVATTLSKIKWLDNYTASLVDDYQAKFDALAKDYAEKLEAK